MSPTTALTLGVLALVGVRLVGGVRVSLTGDGRRIVSRVVTGIRWRHLWPVPFVLTAVGSGVNDWGLRLLNLEDTAFARTVLAVSTVVLALVTDWLVLLWVIARLPRRPVRFRYAARGALYAAVGFEVLKQLGNLYLRLLSFSPTVVAFGALIGLLVFIYLSARMLLLTTVWTAMRTVGDSPAPPPAPGPAVIRPTVVEPGSRAKLVSVAVISALVSHWWTRRRDRRSR